MPTRTLTPPADDTSPRDDGELRYRVEAVTRAVRLMREMRERPASAEDLAAATDIPPAFAQMALETLERHGLARRSEDEWGLGLAWLRLADSRRRQIDLRELALPVMRRMRDDVDETVILCVRRGFRRVNIDYVESTQAIRRVTQHGYETALHVGAAGRALLSGLTPDELGDYFANVATGIGRGAKMFDVAHFISQVDEVRLCGYAQSIGEMASDASATAAPVRDHTGHVIAAITISCPSDRFTPGLEAACIAAVTSGANELSRLLGYSPAGR